MSDEEKVIELKGIIDILIVAFLEFIVILGISLLFLPNAFTLILLIVLFLGYLYTLYNFRHKSKL